MNMGLPSGFVPHVTPELPDSATGAVVRLTEPETAETAGDSMADGVRNHGQRAHGISVR